MHIVSDTAYYLFSFRVEIDGIAEGVDYRSPLNTHFGVAIHLAATLFTDGDRSDASCRIDKALLPQGHITGQVIGVEGVNTIVLSDDEYDVALTYPRDRDVRHVKRLCDHKSVHIVGAQFGEGRRSDIDGIEK